MRTRSGCYVHGLQDDNVRPDHFAKDREQLEQLGVPRNLWLRGGDQGAGKFALTPATGAPENRSFVDDPNQFESAMIAEPEQPDDNRLVFLSEPLQEELRISGTPEINLTVWMSESVRGMVPHRWA